MIACEVALQLQAVTQLNGGKLDNVSCTGRAGILGQGKCGRYIYAWIDHVLPNW